ncbi:hypothetical protein L1987_62156 [Smallanthus sonchifolius]|uniref:Uncharacterized protein n=1 Tax=Smallanthus sonchifolius TaxID=185202 RepID=A0ACB9C9P7_9ASTR|nr:hypothetical protein L1987_62156 [Smallanthus sonchifolius]
MKITLSFISLNLFIFIVTHSLLSTASDIIYDTAGNKLLKGVPYYITPLLRGTGGGLTLSQDSKDACPLDVTQEPFQLNYGVSTSKDAAAANTVTIGGDFNVPESCFQVVEDDVMPGLVSYKIQLCPFKCGTNSTASLTCYNVGVISNPDGKRFLAQTDVIFPMVFENSFGNSVQSV